MAEQWRVIPGWEGHYEASDHGQVRSVDRVVIIRGDVPINLKSKILKPTKFKSGHLTVYLSFKSEKTTVQVHRLVAQAFHGTCPEGMECRHLDGDPENNRPENLVWGTRSENTYDKVRHGTHPQAKKTHCKQGHPFSGDNLFYANGQRRCRECTRASARETARKRRAKNKETIA